MPARTKGKWLTVHALRSGLAEQYATHTGGVAMTVELRWVRESDDFQITTFRGRQIDRRVNYPSLEEARVAFLNEQQRAARPTERTGQ